MADRPDIDRLDGMLGLALDYVPQTAEQERWRMEGLVAQAELVALARRERDARKAVEKVRADEVLAKRTNLEALIASETARAEAAEARVAELEQYRVEWEDVLPAELGWDGATTALQRSEARVAELEAALGRVRDNARSWHGPNNAGSRHAKALAVIAEWCDAALAGDGGGA